MQAQPEAIGIPFWFLILIPWALGTVLLRRANGLSWGSAIGVGLLITLVSGSLLGANINRYGSLAAAHSAHVSWLHSRGMADDSPIAWYLPPFLRVTLGAAMPVLAIPFFIMLWQKWIGTRATEAEKAAGGAGLRAWLSIGNIIWIALLAIGIAVVAELSVLVCFVLLLGLLMAYPLARWIMGAEQEAQEDHLPADDLAPEREKVLSMISENRVTPEEGAELLKALATVQATRTGHPPALSRGRKLVLTGAVLVVVGFFLPWYSINPGTELSRLASSMSAKPNEEIAGLAQKMGMNTSELQPMVQSVFNGMSGNMPKLETADVQISGGQIGHGLGWLILIMATAVAAVPFMSVSLDQQTRRTAEVIALGVGGFLLLYITIPNFRFVTFGLIIVLAGYLFELFGSIREWKSSGTKFRPAG